MITFNTEQVTKNTTSKDLEALNAGCPEVKLQEKSVEYTQNAEYVVSPDAGYDGLSKVNVSVDLVVPTVQNSKTVNITKNGSTTVKPDTDYDAVEQVVVNTNIPLQEKQVDVLLSEPTTVILPDTGYTGITKLTVNHSPVEANTAYTANANGSYTIHPSEGYDATTSVNLTVNVPATPVEPTKSVEITQNGTTNIIPADGYDAIEGVDVTVNVPSKEEETKSVSYTSNGSYTVQPTEGKTLSEVSVSVNVPSSGALDISNKFVSCANQLITQSDIDAFTGWENLTKGDNKFKNATSQELIKLPNPETLTSIQQMFSAPDISRGVKLDVRGQSWSNVKSSTQAFRNISLTLDNKFKFYGSGTGVFYASSITGELGYSAFYQSDNLFAPKFSEWFMRCYFNTPTVSLRLHSSDLMSMFEATNLTSLDLNVYVESPASLQRLCSSCDKLKTLSLSLPELDNTFGTSNYGSFVYGCKVLETVTINHISTNIFFSDCRSLTQDSVNNILNALADVTAAPKTITFAAPQYGYVTEEQKTAATAKGWTINQA